MMGLRAQPAGVILRVLPGHANDRVAIRLREIQLAPVCSGFMLAGRPDPLATIGRQAARRIDERAPLAAGHVIFADREAVDRDPVPRPFDRVAAFLALGRAHVEAAARQGHHLRALAAVAERLMGLRRFGGPGG